VSRRALEAGRPPSKAIIGKVADAARIGVATVRVFEGEAAEARQATLAVLRQAFESAGVEFIEENGGGPGLRLRKRPRAKPSK
jgi:hypothetical protein